MLPDEDTQVNPALDTAEAAVSETAQQEPEQTQAQTEEATEVEASSSDEQPNALQEAAKEQLKPAKNPIKPFQARIDELTRNWRGTERELEAAQARIRELEGRSAQPTDGEQQEQRPQLQPGTVPADMVDRLAETRAAQIANERQFNNDCNLTFMKGKAAHPDFEDALGTFGSLGGLQRDVVEDALGTDAPETVLYMLGKEPEEAMRILALPRNKRIAEFTKMTLKTSPKPNVSKAAAPIKPVGGSAKKEFDYADDSADDTEWQAKRNAERRAAGKI